MSHVRNLLYTPGRHTPEPSPTAHTPHATSGAGPQPVPAPIPVAVRAEAPVEFPVEQAQVRPESRIIYYTDPRSPAADRFRFLRMRLRDLAKTGKLKKLLITSPMPGDGKTTAVLNLATVLAERGKWKVLVMEADLHRGSIAQALNLRAWRGLGECLTDEHESPLSAVRRIEPLGWHLLPAGEPRGNPTEMLQTASFGHVIDKLAASFDWILIDSPPVISLTDALSLHQHADGSLLVARAGQTPREAIKEAVTLLNPKKVLGVILNGAQDGRMRYDQRYYGAGRMQEG